MNYKYEQRLNRIIEKLNKKLNEIMTKNEYHDFIINMTDEILKEESDDNAIYTITFYE